MMMTSESSQGSMGEEDTQNNEIIDEDEIIPSSLITRSSNQNIQINDE